MIDIHTHILPNIDDGSRSIEETFNLIKEAKNVGFDAIVTTSHYMEGYYETNVPEREVWLNAICENMQVKNIDMMLYLGNEIYMSENIIKLLEERKASTINDTSYVLFELPLNVEPFNLYDVIYELQQYKLVPILAHPERYSFVQKEPELIYDLVEKGVLMQANYGSVIGQYGKKAEMTKDKRELLEINTLKKIKSCLEQNIPVRKISLDESEIDVIKSFNLITLKPIIYVANVSEDDILKGGNDYA